MHIDPEAAGLDTRQLERIAPFFLENYVAPGKIAGCQIVVARRGHVGLFESLGLMDREQNKPVMDDTIWRIYSMTKPITGVALMSLYERGKFQLTDPVHRYIPAWRNLKVLERAPDGSERLVEPKRPMIVRDLLMHTSGLSRSFMIPASGVSFLDVDRDLEGLCAEAAEVPLEFHPGDHWLYGISTDVCARLVEILSGQRFDEYLQSTIFDPLGMTDTAFRIPDDKLDRFAASYTRAPDKSLRLIENAENSAYRKQRRFLSGGGGLVSTSADYLRFTQMLLNGGSLGGVRILGRKTVELMTTNHFPGGGDMRSFALPGGYGEVGFDGMGFGLTMAVAQGPTQTGVIGSAGEYMWGGFASTLFWIDPSEELIVIFMTQLIPSGTFNFRGQLKALLYPALL